MTRGVEAGVWHVPEYSTGVANRARTPPLKPFTWGRASLAPHHAHRWRSERATPLLIAMALVLVPVGEGSEVERHWALVAPRRPPLPAVQQTSWPANAIDVFTLAGMEANSLPPARRADWATLQRRMTLDLTGIPPTMEELDADAFTTGPDTYLRLVARLLDSPRFGERMAVPWLDAGRYADTHGFLIDADREMWRWRDWVIGAFNRNLPFDRFTVEQLAGDLLPRATLEQQIASGFNRNHMINFENGADPAEYRAEYVADRAATVANVWMGLSFQCARCHDHKYDPLTIREFYEWSAFFNSVEEEGLDGGSGNAAPFIAAPTTLQQERLAQLEARLASAESQRTLKRNAALAQTASWESTLRSDHLSTAEPQDSLMRVGFEARDQLATRAADQPLSATVNDEIRLTAGRRGQSMLFGGETYVDLGQVSWPTPVRGITLAVWISPTTNDAMRLVVLTDSRRKARLELWLDENRPRLRIVGGNDAAVAVTRADSPIPLWQWQHLAVTWDGTSDGAMQWFLNGLPVRSTTSGTPVRWSAPAGTWRIGGDGDQQGFRGRLDEVQVFARELSSREIAALADADPLRAVLAISSDRRSAEQKQFIGDQYLQRHDEAYRRLSDDVDAMKRQLTELRRSIPTTMVMRELPTPRESFVLQRGKFDQPGDKVAPAVPAFLPPFSSQAPRNRLGLAEWLVQPTHPLTARVMVNRLWQVFFGEGLVRTPDDFGIRGEPPSHPELLDWLAVEFMESGWDVKHIVRLIVTSETYRQSSRLDDLLAQRDPENRWWTRAPRLRLEAEAMRDLLLTTSGLLDPRIGGPSVFPYQPPGLWEEVSYNPAEFTAQAYVPSRGADLYRRGMYTFWKRTLPPPVMAIFDAPTRETCIQNRSRTNSPLQALVLMNEPMSIEAARHLAERGMTAVAGSPAMVIAFMMRVATAREATLGEQRELSDLWERQRSRFQQDPASALQLLAIGESQRNEQLDLAAHAAWTLVANVILCLDETITRN